LLGSVSARSGQRNDVRGLEVVVIDLGCDRSNFGSSVPQGFADQAEI
jgi:hypothetical protein